MVCEPCGTNVHDDCPELARQRDPELTPVVLAGSALCDCAHRPVLVISEGS